MNKLQGAMLGIGALATALAGCSRTQPEFIEGIVMKESGTLVEEGPVNSGKPTYVLTVDTPKGRYVIDVRVGIIYHKSPAALAEAIEQGDRIRFTTSYPAHFDLPDRIGTVPPDYIEVFGR